MRNPAQSIFWWTGPAAPAEPAARHWLFNSGNMPIFWWKPGALPPDTNRSHLTWFLNSGNIPIFWWRAASLPAYAAVGQFRGVAWPVATGTPQAGGGAFLGVAWPVGTAAPGGGFLGVGWPAASTVGVVPASFQGIGWPTCESDTIAGQPPGCVVSPTSDPFTDEEVPAQIF